MRVLGSHVAILMFLNMCATAPSSDTVELQLLGIDYGGCNGESNLTKTMAQPNDSVYWEQGPDTLTYETNDELSIFLGLNYICCAPFVAESALSQDTLVLAVRDTCAIPDSRCYCWCTCYYTFTWAFAVAEEGETNLRVELHDPRADTVATLYQIKLDYH